MDNSLDASTLGVAGLTGFLRSAATTDAAELPAGTRLGDVTIVRLIAEGGMGRVYEGLQGMPCRTVAVKVIRPGLLSPSAARRFEHEAHVLGRLTHPGIARIYSAGVHDHHGCPLPYFVMEHVEEARPITVFAADRMLSVRDRVRLFQQACAAVAHGHQRGVIHRDLKPGNILVDATGQPKVIDFGVARSTDGDVALTTMHTDADQLVGTLQYMCPEQFDGSVAELDVRADVYALGVVFYELLTGHPPYDLRRRHVVDAARVVREVEPQSLSTIDRGLRGDLETIVGTCLEKDRTRRYSSAAELEADLGRYLRGEPIAARRPGLVESLLRLARRHRFAAATAAAVLVATVAALVGISVFAVRADQERRLAVAERERADAASREARDQLYVANLRSLRGCLESRNVRMGRALLTDTLAIAGTPPPLELRVASGGFDDALAVLKPSKTPIKGLKYGPGGSTLAVLATPQPTPWQATPNRPHVRPAMRSQTRFFLGSGAAGRAIPRTLTLYAVGPHGAGSPRSDGVDPWLLTWLESQRASVPGITHADGILEILAVTADGRREAVQDQEGRICIQPRGGGERVTLEGHRGRLNTVVFDEAGDRVAALAQTGHLTLWNATDGRLMGRIAGPDDGVEVFQFSPDGGSIAVVVNRRRRLQEIVVHDTSSGSLLATLSRSHEPGSPVLDHAGTLFAFSPDGARIVTALREHDLRVWRTTDGTLVGTLRGHAAPVTTLSFSPDGRQIASGAGNGAVHLWNAESLELEHLRLGHETAVTAIAFHPDGETLATGEHGGAVRMWSRSAARPLATLPHAGELKAVAFSPEGSRVAVAVSDRDAVDIWHARAIERLRSLPLDGRSVAQLAFAPRGELLAAACGRNGEDGDVLVWDARDGRLLATLAGHVRGAESVAFSPDGTRLLTTSREKVATVWEPRTGRRLMASAAGVRSDHSRVGAVFGLGGSRMAYQMPELFDVDTGEAVVRLAPQGQTTALAASRDGHLLAAGGAIGVVYVSDFTSGKRLAKLPGHADSVNVLDFSPDGSRIASGSLDGTIRLWDVHTGGELRAFHGHEGSLAALAFTPDGQRLVTGSTDGTIRIWQVEGGHELFSLPSRPQHPAAFALSPVGDLLVTDSNAGGIRVWGLSNADVMQARRELTAAP